MNGSTNGTPPDRPPGAPAGLPGGFKVESWHKLTGFCHEEATKRLAQAEAALARAKAERDARLAEVRMLERALALRPDSRRPGEVSGGTGARAATHLLECFVTRFRQSGDPTFTTGVAFLAAKAWPRTTVESGLRRLVRDGLVRRLALGRYELTELGQRQPPAATLPIDRATAEAIAR